MCLSPGFFKEDNDPDGGDTTGIRKLDLRFSFVAGDSRGNFSDYVPREGTNIIYS